MSGCAPDVRELWTRAQDSVRAADSLLTEGFADFAASRAYYAVFYAASALLLTAGKQFKKHTGVISAMHRDYVRTGLLPVDVGRIMNSLFDLRNVGDYGGPAHVSPSTAAGAIADAKRLLDAVAPLLPSELRP